MLFTCKNLMFSDFTWGKKLGRAWGGGGAVQNNQTFVTLINKVNSRNKAISISTFDFSTLYTNIRHWNLKSVTGDLINFSFNSRDKEFIGVTRFGTFWTYNQQICEKNL